MTDLRMHRAGVDRAWCYSGDGATRRTWRSWRMVVRMAEGKFDWGAGEGAQVVRDVRTLAPAVRPPRRP